MTTDYNINADDKYGQLAVIDIAAEAAKHEPCSTRRSQASATRWCGWE